jgi:carbon monoxide dehydrogenase subunit G
MRRRLGSGPRRFIGRDGDSPSSARRIVVSSLRRYCTVVKAQGTNRFAAPREKVYGLLNDPERFARLVPGVSRVEIHDERRWSVETRISLGVTSLRLTMRFLREEERPPEHARLSGSGHSFGTTLSVDTTFQLVEDGEGSELSWSVEAHVGGALGRLEHRVLARAFMLEVARVLTALDRELASS